MMHKSQFRKIDPYLVHIWFISSSYYNFHYNKVYNNAMPLSLFRILLNVACLILCKKPHHLKEGFISKPKLMLRSEFGVKHVIKCGIFTCFQMEQHLLHRAVVHWEAAQTTLLSQRDFIISMISPAIMNVVLRGLSVNYQNIHKNCLK